MSVLRHHITNPYGHDLVKRIQRSNHPAVDEFDIKIRWIRGYEYPRGKITADGGVNGIVEVGHKTIRLTLKLGMVAGAFKERIDDGIVEFLTEVTQ